MRQTILSNSYAVQQLHYDSNRYYGMEGGKSCETIPEGNEMEFQMTASEFAIATDLNEDEKEDGDTVAEGIDFCLESGDGLYDDLLSIDRVTFFCYF